MRIGLLVLAGVVAAVAAAWGIGVVSTASTGGCPAALLEGTLAEAATGDALVVVTDRGEAVTVSWPIGYGTARGANGELVLTRLWVQVARPGDRVSMGGSEGGVVEFAGCGVITVTAGPASPEPRQPDLDPSIGPQG
jgi:hypothetical protein